MKLKPSDFTKYPWSSVLQNMQSEVIAHNIMIILNRKGNEFKDLTWEEYKEERIKDGNFSEEEKSYFNNTIPYCKSAQTASLFSKEWNFNTLSNIS